MQAAPFVEQHTLRPFVDQPAGGSHQVPFIGDPYRAGELRVDLDQSVNVGMAVIARRE